LDLSLANSFGNFRKVNFYDAKVKEFDVDNNENYQIDALLRFHFKINPDNLDDEEYFNLYAQLEWVIRMENEKYKNKD